MEFKLVARIGAFVVGAFILFAPGRASAAPDLEFDVVAPQLNNQKVHIQVFLPPNYDADKRYPVLYFNDGQDAKAIHLEQRLARHFAQAGAVPRIVVAVNMLPDRMGTYGLANTATGQSEIAPTRYGNVGASAEPYTQWFAQTLVPAIDARLPTVAMPQGRAVLGWSLGAISAFSIGWQHPQLFSRIGMFSPSLWLSKNNDNSGQVLATRLIQNRVANDPTVPQNLQIYLAIGTAEDTDDRDQDGVNDAVDDVMDLANGWESMPGLTQRAVPHTTVLLVGGQHNQSAWSEMLPRFLNWLDEH